MVKPHVWQDLLLAIVLGFAAYLSAAAIAAMPVLMEDVQSSQAEVADFRTLLQGDDRQVRPRSREFLTSDPFAPLLKAVEDTQRVGAARSRIAPITFDETVLNGMRRDLDRIRIEVENAVEYWTRSVNQARGQAIVLFAQNADRKGNAERHDHHTRLLLWFDVVHSAGQREINECVLAAQLATNTAAAWAGALARQLTRRAGQDPDTTPKIQMDLPMQQCGEGSRWAFPPAPLRSELGARFGAFRPVAEWLVRTESLSLVSVVGLFGFGLLGAAASTIIREKGAQRAPDSPLVSDLPSVIVRGMVAAMVVFLSVKGGLTIFAEGSPEPNPYALLLMCLIAAIFSEPVFEAAQSYLNGLVERSKQHRSGGA